MSEDAKSRLLGANEMYCDRCHAHGNLNVTLALTIHTRTALDPGQVKIALQELQHQYPQLTSRIKRQDGKEMFTQMECPVLPLDESLQCGDMVHQMFDTEHGPLWRVQLVTVDLLDQANLAFGPEVEAILEDDASRETRWRNLLRYLQGRLNQDIGDFEEMSSEEERSVLIMSFHPAITDTTGAFYFAKQFLLIMDLILESAGTPLNPLPAEKIHSAVETLLPSPDGAFHIGDLFAMGKAVGNHFLATRKSPYEDRLSNHHNTYRKDLKSQFIRGWLTELETTELLALCEEDDVSLHGVLLAAALTATARICLADSSPSYPPQESIILRASSLTNLRQYCASSPRHGCLTSNYEENYTVPPVQDSADFWRLAHTLTMAHNTAKSNRQPLKQLRMYSKMFATVGGEAAFKDMEKNRKIVNEMTVTVHGDLGHVFRRESSSYQSLDSWTRPTPHTRHVRLEDVLPLVAAHNMGSPFTHSAHVLNGRLNYSLAFYTTYVDTTQALMLRDETINILRQAVDHSG